LAPKWAHADIERLVDALHELSLAAYCLLLEENKSVGHGPALSPNK
jgi:hypothetical protein